jgi:hypothetical protein
MRRRSFWSLAPGELRVILAVFAAVLWAMIVAVWVRAPIPCGDFVCPYTMGSLVWKPERLYNVEAFHAAQVALVPASAPLFYPPVYPPHLAVLMAPFSRLPYGVAVTVWSALTIALYAAILRTVYRTLRPNLDAASVAFAAVAFPPFAQVVGYGQNTVLLMGACFLAWKALLRQNSFLAGAALGLLALKPQFGLPFAVVVVAGREWRMLGGAVCSMLLQALIVLVVMGPAALTGFAALVPEIVRNADALESVPEHTHSLRAMTQILPPAIGQPVWIAGVAVLLLAVAQVWRSAAPVHVRLGFTVVTAVLVSPHLIVYDAVLLALPLLWFSEWFASRHVAESYWPVIGLLFVALEFSWARVLLIQPSVILMLWILHLIWKHTLTTTPPVAEHV